MIRARLRYFNVDRDLRTLLVISAAQGDGKTTVSRRLAEAAAAMGASTLLVEADLRAPTLAPQLKIAPGPGLSDVLSGAILMSDAIQTLDVGLFSSEGRAKHRMDVLLSGTMLPPNPAELIESRAMLTVLEGAKSAYQFVVIDTPPLTGVSDVFPLLSKVDGIVVVGRMGNRRDLAQGLHETLQAVEAPLLGVVANGFNARGLTPYAYGSEPREGPTPPADSAEDDQHVDHALAPCAARKIEQRHLDRRMRAGIADQRALQHRRDDRARPASLPISSGARWSRTAADEAAERVAGHRRRRRCLAPADRAVRSPRRAPAGSRPC